jgi:hypothetical protein
MCYTARSLIRNECQLMNKVLITTRIPTVEETAKSLGVTPARAAQLADFATRTAFFTKRLADVKTAKKISKHAAGAKSKPAAGKNGKLTLGSERGRAINKK